MFLMIPVHLKVALTIIITVDRSNILKTTFAEFESIGDFCKTFEVDFMGEEARDLRVPRKEWILMNHAMKEKYFANGLREFLADDYFFVGVMIGIALKKKGQLPCFLPLHVIDRLVNKREVDKCVINIQRGLDVC